MIAGRGWIGQPTPVGGFDELRVLHPARVDRARAARIERQVAFSTGVLSAWLDRCQQPYVSFSGGKDSTVLAHLVRSLDARVPLLYVADAEGCTPDVQQMRAWHTAAGYPSDEVLWGSFFEAYEQHGLEAPAIDRLYSQRVIALVTERGYDGCARGLRADESRGRAMHARTHGHTRQRSDSDVIDCDPLLSWSADDVWAYIAAHGLPYSRMYDEPDNQPRARRRIGTLWGTTAASTGRLARLKRHYPQEHARFVQRFPELTVMT